VNVEKVPTSRIAALDRSAHREGAFNGYLGHLPDAEVEAMLNELAIGVLRTNLDSACEREAGDS
jgi:hypothetical protein